jgi:glutathione S-transferase
VKKFTHQGPPDPGELEKGDMQFHRFAAVLDDHLQGRGWLVGKNLTLADYAVAATLDLAEAAHMPVEKYRNIRRWYADIEKLDAWKKSAPANFLKKAG